MITIIFAPPRTGKTSLMTHILREAMFNRERNMCMRNEIIAKQQSGFTNIKTIPEHCVSANYNIVGRMFRCSPRRNRFINPYRLGFANPFVTTHFNFPYEVIGITEAQKYLNSRMSRLFPDWQSRWYEQHGHNDLDIYLDTQRPMLIDVNIRDLSRFIEVVSSEFIVDKFGRKVGMSWIVRIIPDSRQFERYMTSGGKDSTCYTEKKIVADYNVGECYDHQSCKPKFYDGHFEQDFDYEKSKPLVENIDGYVDYLEKNDDELPVGFYQKRSNVNEF